MGSTFTRSIMRVTIYIPAGLINAARSKMAQAFDREGGLKTFAAPCVPAPGPGGNITFYMANFEAIERPVLRLMRGEYGADLSGLPGEFPGAKVYIDTPVADSLADMGLKIKGAQV